MEDIAELRKLAMIAREMAATAFDTGARERFTAVAAEYEERARLIVDIQVAPSLVPLGPEENEPNHGHRRQREDHTDNQQS
ncbi:hypothetical protein [Tardiphaga alba]|uniref:hypothetical protein n=1 Tax=Tardiphaga alba TaxID=340268 RepID=UPI001BA9D805|nr:hypothetical protein [Tardiphaga alba]